jgi:hypothetical protein
MAAGSRVEAVTDVRVRARYVNLSSPRAVANSAALVKRSAGSFSKA